MKIACLTLGVYPIHIGGPTITIYHLMKEWIKLGMRVVVFVPVTQPDAIKLNNLLPGCEIIRLRPWEGVCLSAKIFSFLQGNLMYLKNLHRLMDCDVVHFNFPPAIHNGVLPMLSSKIGGKKLTLDLHGGILIPEDLAKPSSIFSLQRAFFLSQRDMFDLVIVHSKFMKKIADGFGLRSLRVMPLGVDCDRFERVTPHRILSGSPKILFVGRLENIKGIDILLNSFKYVVQEIPSARLYIVGKGSMRQSLEDLAASLGIANKVHFKGPLVEHDLAATYMASDLCVFPSLYGEGFGIVLLEAMACRKPVIASRVGGMKEVIQNCENGVLVTPGDPRELAEKILHLVDNPNFSSRLVNNAYKNVRQNNDWSRIAKQYLELFLLN
jgi:glycosyltransferase involved in cell wall biosynthesis